MADSIISEEYLAHVEALRQEERLRVEQEIVTKKAVYDELIELGLSETSALTVSGYKLVIEPEKETETAIINIIAET